MGVNVSDRGFLSQLLVLFPLGKITHDVTASLPLNVRIKNFGSEANVYTMYTQFIQSFGFYLVVRRF